MPVTFYKISKRPRLDVGHDVDYCEADCEAGTTTVGEETMRQRDVSTKPEEERSAPAQRTAQPLKDAALGGARAPAAGHGARAPGPGLLGGALRTGAEVPRAAASDVVPGAQALLVELALVGARELVLERYDRPLDVGVRVARAAAARVEVPRAAGGHHGGDGRGDAGGRGGQGRTEVVAGATAAGVDVGVFGDGGVGLGDGVGGHFCSFWLLIMWWCLKLACKLSPGP